MDSNKETREQLQEELKEVTRLLFNEYARCIDYDSHVRNHTRMSNCVVGEAYLQLFGTTKKALRNMMGFPRKRPLEYYLPLPAVKTVILAMRITLQQLRSTKFFTMVEFRDMHIANCQAVRKQIAKSGIDKLTQPVEDDFEKEDYMKMVDNLRKENASLNDLITTLQTNAEQMKKEIKHSVAVEKVLERVQEFINDEENADVNIRTVRELMQAILPKVPYTRIKAAVKRIQKTALQGGMTVNNPQNCSFVEQQNIK